MSRKKIKPYTVSILALKRYYNDLNKRWFRNRLPRNIKLMWHKESFLGLGCVCNSFIISRKDGKNSPDSQIIIPPEISLYTRIRFSKSLITTTLLHEMAHLATQNEKPGHGKQWHREMNRLWRIGAFDKVI